MRSSTTLLLGLLSVLSTTACAGAGEEVGSDEGALVANLTPLVAADFSTELTKGFIEGTHTLPASAFATKWTTSRADSALMFFRAYPAAYHKDFAQNLRAAAKAKIPAGTGLCYGDPHPDNFGFLKFDAKVIYAFNDLDDSGQCPVALDALRYVTAVRLYFGKDLAETAAKRYVKVLRGELNETDVRKDIASLREEFAPDFSERRADKLGDLVKGDTLASGDGVEPAPADARAAVGEAVTKALPTATVLDVGVVKRDGGGSGGLMRYWALVRRGSVRSLLELKEAAKPAVDHGLEAKPMSEAARLPLLKKELWGVSAEKDYFYVSAMKKTFLVRDRLAKASLDLSKLKSKELEDVIQAQASTVALLHKGTLKVASDDDAKTLRTWLDESASVMATRWKRAHD